MQLVNASNGVMDVLGKCTIRLSIPKLGKTLDHKFTMLNVRTYITLLLGRDFSRKMGAVTIDVEKGWIKMCGRWIKGEKASQRVQVRLQERFISPAWLEHFICKNSKVDGMILDFEFVPAKFFPSGVYVMSAHTRPCMNGYSIIGILNINEHDVMLKIHPLTCRTYMPH